jgi:hypothetical protein
MFVIRMRRSLAEGIITGKWRLYREHVFAEIKPATRTRIDVGLALGDAKVPPRLIDTGGLAKKNRITRRIPITSLGEIDDEVNLLAFGQRVPPHRSPTTDHRPLSPQNLPSRSTLGSLPASPSEQQIGLLVVGPCGQES